MSVRFADGCLIRPAPDREESVKEVFFRAAKTKKGNLNLRKGVRILIERIAIFPEEKWEEEGFIAARVIRRACPETPIDELVKRVVDDAAYLTFKRPKLTMAATIIIAFLALFAQKSH